MKYAPPPDQIHTDPRVLERRARLTRELRPRDQVEDDLIGQLSLHGERGATLAWLTDETRRIVRARMLAMFAVDREREAADLATRLAREPEKTLPRLKGSVAGLDLLLDRWRALAGGLRDGSCSWTDVEINLALDLIGLAGPLREFHPEARRLRGLVAAAIDLENPEGDAALRRLRDRIAAVLRSLRAWRNCVAHYEAESIEAIGRGALLEENPFLKVLHRLEADAHRGFDRAYRALCKLRGGKLIAEAPEAPVSPPSPPSPAATPSAAASPAVPPRRRFANLEDMAHDRDGVVDLMRVIKSLEKSQGGTASEIEIEAVLRAEGHLTPTPRPGPGREVSWSGRDVDDGIDA